MSCNRRRPPWRAFWPDADRLEIHAENRRDAVGLGRAGAVIAVDPVQHRLDFQAVVGAHAGVAGRVVVAGLRALSSVSCELISGAKSSSRPRARRAAEILVGGMLVGPGGVQARRLDDFEDRVGATRIECGKTGTHLPSTILRCMLFVSSWV